MKIDLHLTYTVAGDNSKKSLEILKSISKYADICELGFLTISLLMAVDSNYIEHWNKDK